MRVFSPEREHREAFAREMAERTKVEVEPVGRARDAVTGADVVVTITKAESPVFDGALIEPGVHINAAGSNRAQAREIDLETIRRADRIVIGSRSQGRSEAGDLIPAVDEDALGWSEVAELGELLAGAADGRTSDAQITLFESLGITSEDVAVARVVYEGALERGAGVELPPYPGLQLHALPEQRP